MEGGAQSCVYPYDQLCNIISVNYIILYSSLVPADHWYMSRNLTSMCLIQFKNIQYMHKPGRIGTYVDMCWYAFGGLLLCKTLMLDMLGTKSAWSWVQVTESSKFLSPQWPQLSRWTAGHHQFKGWNGRANCWWKTSFKPRPIQSANQPHDSHLALPVSPSPFCTLSHWTWNPFVAHICRPAASGASKLTMLTNSPFPSFSHLFILDTVEGTGGIHQPWGTEQNPDSPIAGYKSQTACREWSRQFVESSRNKDGKWQLCITYIYSIISSWHISLYLVHKTTQTRKCCWKLDDSWWFHIFPYDSIPNHHLFIISESQWGHWVLHTPPGLRTCWWHLVAHIYIEKKHVWKLNGLWCLNINLTFIHPVISTTNQP